MRVQVFSFTFLAILAVSPAARAGGQCFDFTKPIEKSLKDPTSLDIAPLARGGIAQDSGDTAAHLTWAAVEGDVDRSIADLVGELKTHEVTKSSKIDSMDVFDLTDSQFLTHQQVRFKIVPFPFINIEWTEDWVFSSLKPDQQFLVSYEKTEGTSHISHLCGNFYLRRLDARKSRVFIYEEAQATRRSREDTLNGIRTTLQKLRIVSPAG